MYILYYYILFTERLQGVFVNFCEDFKFGFVGLWPKFGIRNSELKNAAEIQRLSFR
jgi:hypothetical protein